MLTKDLLRVSRAGGGYRPQFATADDEPLARRVLATYREHVGERRERLEAALTALEAEADDFKLVRGFAKLCEREATFETRAPLEPRRAREAAFAAAESVGVVTETDRETALTEAADRLDASPADVGSSLYADLEARQVLAAFEPRWTPGGLVDQYNLSLAQTALFDAVEVRLRSSDPTTLISGVKRHRLLYEIRRIDPDAVAADADWTREVIVTGPDALFRRSRRYGTRFARLLRTVAAADRWQLEATIDDRGTDRELVLTDADLTVPGTDPVADEGPDFDSAIEADFYARFRSLDLDWELVREPEPLAAGEHVVVPDFAADWRYGSFRVYVEIMGFWTPEYVEKKLARFADLEDVELIVAYDETLGVGEALAATDHRAFPYRGHVRMRDVREALRPYEDRLRTASAAALPDEIVPDADVTTIAAVAADYDVPEAAAEDASYPDHERVGRTLIRPDVLKALTDEIDAGMTLSDAEAVLDDHGIADASATLARLGYRVEWEGLGGGTIREK